MASRQGNRLSLYVDTRLNKIKARLNDKGTQNISLMNYVVIYAAEDKYIPGQA
jgi:delta-aminolevulinic acid dehydratase/porphobilinogen synthase